MKLCHSYHLIHHMWCLNLFINLDLLLSCFHFIKCDAIIYSKTFSQGHTIYSIQAISSCFVGNNTHHSVVNNSHSQKMFKKLESKIVTLGMKINKRIDPFHRIK